MLIEKSFSIARAAGARHHGRAGEPDRGVGSGLRVYPRRWGFMNWSQESRTACLAGSSSGAGPRPARPPPPPAPAPAAAPPPIAGLLRVFVFSLNTPRTTMRRSEERRVGK